MKPVAIIVGSDGQDGQLLKIKLKSLDYSIVGITKNTIDITNPKQVSKLISKTKPKEIYFLAAFHHSSEEILITIGNCFAGVLIFMLLPRSIFSMQSHSILP